MKIKFFKHQLKFLNSSTTYTILRAGRGSGKTFAASYLIARALSRGQNVLATAQTYKSLKKVLYTGVKKALRSMNMAFSENKNDMTIELTSNKAAANFYSADESSEESIRGLTDISILVMDEAALASSEFFDLCIATCRGSDVYNRAIDNPQYYLITTPKGRLNWVSRLERETDPSEITIIVAKTSDNTKNSSKFISILQKRYKGAFAAQELDGVIVDEDSADALIPSSILYNALINKWEYKLGRVIIGIDPSRFGKDTSEFFIRQGCYAKELCTLQKSDTFDLIQPVMTRFKPEEVMCVNIDCTGGYGAGAADALRKLNYTVNEINSSAKSPDPMYKGLRSFMYYNTADAFENGLRVVRNEMLVEELQAHKRLISKGGLADVINKEDIRREIGRSPDKSDALALTFATSPRNDTIQEDEFYKVDKPDEGYNLADDLIRSSNWGG